MTEREKMVGFGAFCLGIGVLIGAVVPRPVAVGVGLAYFVAFLSVAVRRG